VKVLKVLSIVLTLLLLAGMILFEFRLHTSTDDLWLAMKASTGIALLANFGFGAVAASFASIYRWLEDLDPTEHILMFGLKVGLTVFIFLTIISIVLKMYGEPPTYGPAGLAVGTYFMVESGACCMFPDVGLWIAELFGTRPTSRRRSRGRSGSTNLHPPPR
jgi:hypothetical protein